MERERGILYKTIGRLPLATGPKNLTSKEEFDVGD
jgi:hypothetical protein